MPRLSDSMEEGTIVDWLKDPGVFVERDESFVEVETDKATMPFEAEAAGYLKVLVAAGSTVAVGTPIAELHPTPEMASAAPGGQSPARLDEVASTAPAVAAAPEEGRPIGISPVARRVAMRMGVELDGLVGSGPFGRILKRDVLEVAARGGKGAGDQAEVGRGVLPPPAGAGADIDTGPAERIPLSRSQHVVATRMTQSQTEFPTFTVEIELDLTAALAMRQELKEVVDVPPSVNDLMIKAAAFALRRHPKVNSSFDGDAIIVHEDVNVGVAVAADERLVVPTVFQADTRRLDEITAETKLLVEKVRDSSITPAELSGATFTVSNLGMFGVRAFTAMINPPQAAILAVGAAARLPRFDVDDRVVARDIAYATLTCDHRVVYGADASAFLADLRGFFDRPLALMS